ncbi:MAG: hypothetical protein U1E73_11400, partial [Planctomycetota bacterium]
WTAWQVEEENPRDEATCQREFEQKLAELPAVTDADLDSWLVVATSLLQRLDLPEPPLRPDQEWRRTARVRIAAWQRVATQRALAEWGYPYHDLVRALAAWNDPKACEAPAAVLIRAGLASRSTLDVNCVLDLLQAPVEDPALRSALWAMLGDGDVLGGDRALQLLPAEEQCRVPPVLVIAGQDPEWAEGVVALLASTSAGRAELRRRLQDPEFVKRQRDALAKELPETLWQAVPLAAFATWAATLAHPEDASVAELVTRITAQRYPTPALQQAMFATRVPAWRDVLARVLRARGADLAGVAGPAEDPAWPFWQRVLALGAGDAPGAAALGAQLQANTALAPVADERDCMLAMLVRAIAAVGTPVQLYAARELMDSDTWRTAWARLAGTNRVALVAQFQRRIPDEFVPATPAEADALWQFLGRSGDAETVFGVMRQSHCGVACLRAHLLAGELAPYPAELAKDGLEAELRAPAGTESWALLLTAFSPDGPAPDLEPIDRERLLDLRRLRGLGPIGP